MTSVVKALNEVMRELGGIGKGERSPEGWTYRGIEAMTKKVQPLAAEHGVLFVPFATVVDIVPSPAMKDGWTDTRMTVDWRIYGPDGDYIEARTSGIGRDRADKGANKAQTQAFKYLLLHLLIVADTADDTDGVDYESDRSTSRRQTARPQRSGGQSVQLREEVALGDNERGASQAQLRLLMAQLSGKGIGDEQRHKWASEQLGRDVTTFADLASVEVSRLIDILRGAQ